MRSALEGSTVETFISPKQTSTGKPILDGSFAIEERVTIDRASGKLATERTPPEWITERVYRVIHDTLFWVTRSDPRGDPPQNPFADPQFANWENAAQNWITQDPALAQSVAQRPPEEFDDVHVPENEPRVSFLEPARNRIVAKKERVSLRVSAQAPFGISQVVVFLDGVFATTLVPTSQNVFSGFVSIPANPAQQTIDVTVRAFDPWGNRGERTLELILQDGSAANEFPFFLQESG